MKERRAISLAILVSFCIGVCIWYVKYIRDFSEISKSSMSSAIESAKIYLVGDCKPTGEFIYRIDSESNQIRSGYNIVRHSGAMYSLLMYYDEHPSVELLNVLIQAGRFLEVGYMAPVIIQGRSEPLMAILAKPVGTPNAQRTALGGNGLGLAVLCSIEQDRPKSFDIGKLEALGNFVLCLQKENGEFYDKYDLGTGMASDESSLYFPGEAILGLISLYELTHDTKWLIAAGKGLSFLADSRKEEGKVPPDCWALIATEKFLPFYSQSVCSVSKRTLIAHSIQISQSIIKDQITGKHLAGDSLYGGFDSSGKTTPTATRMEGLLAALNIIPKSHFLLRFKMERAIALGMEFLLRSQIKDGPYAGGIPRAMPYLKNAGLESTQVDPHAAEIRIDYVQHGLSAFLRYEKFAFN